MEPELTVLLAAAAIILNLWVGRHHGLHQRLMLLWWVCPFGLPFAEQVVAVGFLTDSLLPAPWLDHYTQQREKPGQNWNCSTRALTRNQVSVCSTQQLPHRNQGLSSCSSQPRTARHRSCHDCRSALYDPQSCGVFPAPVGSTLQPERKYPSDTRGFQTLSKLGAYPVAIILLDMQLGEFEQSNSFFVVISISPLITLDGLLNSVQPLIAFTHSTPHSVETLDDKLARSMRAVEP